MSVTSYEIIVYTGKQRGAGTDSQVYITLFGKDGKQTEKIHLLNPVNNKNPFERDQIDKFRVHANHIGELNKLRIEQDDSGQFSGWFLDQITVTNLQDPKTKYVGICNKWLAKDEDDGQISRELILNKDVDKEKKNNQYKVTVHTGNRKGAGTDADVFLTLYGSLGKSDAIMLYSKKNDFEVGSKDEFKIECPSVGELNKICIAHNNKGVAPGWFLDRILIEDLNQKHLYGFPCNRWLSTDEDDGQISRFLFRKQPTEQNKNTTTTTGITYNITVYTGDKPNAGTDAKVYLVMHNNELSSDRILLNGGKFERKSIDSFIIDAPNNLKSITALDIGHDGSGLAPGWYLSKVVIECPSTGIKQTFPCNAWLDDKQGDNRIERRLKEDLLLRQTYSPTIPWYLWVYTSDMKGAGTDALVNLVLYGQHGKSHDINLQTVFEAGCCTEFKVDLADVGSPFKLRVSHDNTKLFSAWHLDRIEMENLNTKERYIFRCGKWLSTQDDDKQIVRELPAEGPGIPRPLPIVKYMVDVYTGDKFGGGTSANVFINIFGECGDTGDRPLEYSSENKNKFEANQVDKFVLEAVSLKQIRKIRIGHDGTGLGEGWFLDKVVIRSDDQHYQPVTFLCNRWLAADEDDGKIVRELTLGPAVQYSDKTMFNVRIKTGDVFGGGTDAAVYMKIFGDKGNTERIPLTTAAVNFNLKANKFERAQIDTFAFELTDIGQIKYIIIGHNGQNPGAGWFLDWVEIDVPPKGELYKFACNRWLDKKEGDGKIELELLPSNINKKGGGNKQSVRDVNLGSAAKNSDKTTYNINIKTADVFGGGTDAAVHLQIFGEKGYTDKIQLTSTGINFNLKSNKFERGQLDSFTAELNDLGQIKHILIGHNGQNPGAGWFLDWVEIDVPTKGEHYKFPCNRWLDKKEGDGKIEIELLPSNANKKAGGNKPSVRDANLGSAAHYADKTIFNVRIKTGDVFQGGTDAAVYMKIFGDKGNTDKIELSTTGVNFNLKSNKFERGQIDTFAFELTDIGQIRYIIIGHNGQNPGAGWFLDWVEIDVPPKGEHYKFVCNRWLDKKEGDGKIELELLPSDLNKKGGVKGNKQGIPDVNLGSTAQHSDKITYDVKVKTADVFGAGTDAAVHLQIYGDKGFTNKIQLTSTGVNFNLKSNKFERGQIDNFTFELNDIGQIKHIVIGHDGQYPGAGWFLDWVEIDVPTKGEHYKFVCNRWLDKKEGDGKIEIELLPSNANKKAGGNKPSVRDANLGSAAQNSSKIVYDIKVKTGDVFQAGTDASVYIQIIGDKAYTDKIQLSSTGFNFNLKSNKFERGQLDSFTCELSDLGQIKHIVIGHTGQNPGAGWFLDWVEIDVPTKGEHYKFACNRWLDKKEGDGKIEIQLLPTDANKKAGGNKPSVRDANLGSAAHYADKTIFNVRIKTGDVFQGGTDAAVYMKIFGDKGNTDKIELSTTGVNFNLKSNKFERGQIDTFAFELTDIGQIKHIIIGHNGQNPGAGWFLDWVEIDVPTRGEYYKFSCNRWLDKKEGDGKIEIQLLPTDVDKKAVVNKPIIPDLSLNGQLGKGLNNRNSEVVYAIHVFTGDKFGGGTDANVFLRIYGENEVSGEYELFRSKTNRDKFQPNKEDIFEVKSVPLGILKKINIRHDNSGIASGWYLDRVEIIDTVTRNKYQFICQKWLAIDEDDKVISREIPVLENRLGNLSSSSPNTSLDTKKSPIPYKISVTTAKDLGSGTNAKVYIIIFGKNNNTGNIPLVTTKTNTNPFENGQTDVFDIEAADIGEPTKIKIGHNNAGIFSDWLLEKVEITIPKLGRTWIFPCHKWISTSKGDNTLELELYPKAVPNEGSTQNAQYEIKVYTSNIFNGGTDANIFIEIYGIEKRTGEVSLCHQLDRKGRFQAGAVDTFIHQLIDVGNIRKIRIGHDNTGFGPAWHVDHIEIRRVVEGQKTKTFIFPCNRWFAKDEDDRLIVRQLYPGKTVEDKIDNTTVQRRLKPYIIHVYTGDKFGAGTDANVYCTIYGDKGDSGEKELTRSETNKNKFEKGQNDKFTIQVPDLGNISKIKIRHDNSGMFSDWLLAKIEIKDDIKTYVFICEQWLGKKEGDGKIERILFEKNSQSTEKLRTAETSDIGTDGNVFIRLIGRNDQQTHMIPGGSRQRLNSQSEKVAKFALQESDMGDLETIEIEHDDDTLTNNWKLDDITVEMLAQGRAFYSACDKWLTKQKGDGKTKHIRKLQTSIRTLIPYEVKIYTADVENAGCKCNISLKLFGTKGSSSEYIIEKDETNFTRAAMDVFQCKLDDVGSPIQLRVTILPKDTKGQYQWYLEKIQFIKLAKQNEKQETFIFNLNDWISQQTDYHRDIPLINAGNTLLKTTNPHYDVPNGGKFSSNGITYRITTKTSDLSGAGTDSNVFITLTGQNGCSDELELAKSTTNWNKFERNKEDTFIFENILNLGQLTKIRVRKDESGLFDNCWHLESVKIEDTHSRQIYMFPCGRWLSTKKDDRQLVRELSCLNNSTNRRALGASDEKSIYEIEVVTLPRQNSGTIHNGWIIIEGDKNKSERLLMRNSPQNQILRDGQTNKFAFECRPLGEVRRIILGHQEQRASSEPRWNFKSIAKKCVGDKNAESSWHVSHIVITDVTTGAKYECPVRQRIDLNNPGDVFECTGKKNNTLSQQPRRRLIEYKVFLYTGTVLGAGTDANVSINIFGTLGESGIQSLQQPGRNLFERGQVDEFIIESADLGQLKKFHIEHDNASSLADWFLEKVEVFNMDTRQTVIFPCNKWIGKNRDDGHLQQDLLPMQV